MEGILDMSFKGMLIHRATIRMVTTAIDDNGCSVETWSDRWPSVRCRIQELSSREVARNRRVELKTTHKMYLEPCELDTSDRVDFNGRTFEITGKRDVDELGRVMVLELEETTNG